MSIADDIINGDFCQFCGEYLGDGAGFPQSCAGCEGSDDDYDGEDDYE